MEAGLPSFPHGSSRFFCIYVGNAQIFMFDIHCHACQWSTSDEERVLEFPYIKLSV